LSGASARGGWNAKGILSLYAALLVAKRLILRDINVAPSYVTQNHCRVSSKFSNIKLTKPFSMKESPSAEKGRYTVYPEMLINNSEEPLSLCIDRGWYRFDVESAEKAESGPVVWGLYDKIKRRL